MQIIVTGSARLDHFRKGGDSLLGRYIPYRLHPFTLNENSDPNSADDFLTKIQNNLFSEAPIDIRFNLEDLMTLTGFPEPLLGANQARANRWSKLRLEKLKRLGGSS